MKNMVINFVGIDAYSRQTVSETNRFVDYLLPDKFAVHLQLSATGVVSGLARQGPAFRTPRFWKDVGTQNFWFLLRNCRNCGIIWKKILKIWVFIREKWKHVGFLGKKIWNIWVWVCSEGNWNIGKFISPSALLAANSSKSAGPLDVVEEYMFIVPIKAPQRNWKYLRRGKAYST